MRGRAEDWRSLRRAPAYASVASPGLHAGAPRGTELQRVPRRALQAGAPWQLRICWAHFDVQNSTRKKFGPAQSLPLRRIIAFWGCWIAPSGPEGRRIGPNT